MKFPPTSQTIIEDDKKGCCDCGKIHSAAKYGRRARDVKLKPTEFRVLGISLILGKLCCAYGGRITENDMLHTNDANAMSTKSEQLRIERSLLRMRTTALLSSSCCTVRSTRVPAVLAQRRNTNKEEYR